MNYWLACPVRNCPYIVKMNTLKDFEKAWRITEAAVHHHHVHSQLAQISSRQIKNLAAHNVKLEA